MEDVALHRVGYAILKTNNSAETEMIGVEMDVKLALVLVVRLARLVESLKTVNVEVARMVKPALVLHLEDVVLHLAG